MHELYLGHLLHAGHLVQSSHQRVVQRRWHDFPSASPQFQHCLCEFLNEQGTPSVLDAISPTTAWDNDW